MISIRIYGPKRYWGDEGPPKNEKRQNVKRLLVQIIELSLHSVLSMLYIQGAPKTGTFLYALMSYALTSYTT